MGKHNGKARKAGLRVGAALANRHKQVISPFLPKEVESVHSRFAVLSAAAITRFKVQVILSPSAYSAASVLSRALPRLILMVC